MAKHFPKIVTPAGTAAYAWLTKADDKFDKDNPKYKVTLVMDQGEEADAFIERVEELGRAQAEKDNIKLKKNIKLPVEDGDDKTDRDGNPREEFAGKVLVSFKSKFKPGQFDAARQVLPDEMSAMSGDTVKVSALVKPYEAFGSGISLQLRNVQLLEKNSSAGGSGDEFEEEEGFVVKATDDEIIDLILSGAGDDEDF